MQKQKNIKGDREMAKIFLTSNGLSTEIIKHEFITALKQLTNPKAVIITTASPQKEKNKYASKTKNDLLQIGLKQVDFLDVEVEEAKKLKQYNIIYINGGNPFHLLYYIKKSGADTVISKLSKQNAIIMGTSAGALILGPHIEVVNHFTPEMNKIGMNDFTALNITDKAIFPHYDREDVFQDNSGQSIEDRIREFESNKHVSIVRLQDNQYILANG